MAQDGVRFIRVRGRIVPIKNKGGVNKTLSGAALATNVVSGVVSGLSLVGSRSRVLFGQSASLGLDLLSSGANIKAHQGIYGRGNRYKAIAKQEAVNHLAGYSAFAITALAHKPTRDVFKASAMKGISFVGSILKKVAR